MNGRAQGKNTIYPALGILSLSFLAGGVVGCLAEGAIIPVGTITRFLSEAAKGMTEPSMGRELWSLVRWPLATLAVGQLPVIGPAMSGLFFLRGFFLSFSISALVAGNGMPGWLCGGLIFGPICLLSLPVFFLVGIERLIHRSMPPYYLRCRALIRVSVLLLLSCGLLEHYVMPVVLPVLLKKLT